MKRIITHKLVHIPSRNFFSHKGQNGRVLIVGGSQEYIGAPALAGIATLRSGADSVVIAAPYRVAWAINSISPDLITKKLRGNYLTLAHYNEIISMLKTADCLLIGNGIVERKESKALMRKLISSYQGYKVLDAGALASFEPKTLSNAVLLPNHAEYERLQSYCNVQELIEQGNIIVQKSARTLIHSTQGLFENRTGNAGLTKAGTGDVLAGLIAGFIAQSKNSLQSAINGVYFLGKIGDVLLKEKRGYFYLASDLAEEIKRIHRKKL